MAERSDIPLSSVLGDRGHMGNVVKVEESWSKYVVPDAGVSVVDDVSFDREAAILAAAKRRREREANALNVEAHPSPQVKRGQFHFFVLKGKVMDFIGSKEMDASKFSRDISGRFFREWLKKEFPGRSDYSEIISFEDKTTVKEIVELLVVCV